MQTDDTCFISCVIGTGEQFICRFAISYLTDSRFAPVDSDRIKIHAELMVLLRTTRNLVVLGSTTVDECLSSLLS